MVRPNFVRPLSGDKGWKPFHSKRFHPLLVGITGKYALHSGIYMYACTFLMIFMRILTPVCPKIVRASFFYIDLCFKHLLQLLLNFLKPFWILEDVCSLPRG